MRLSVLILGAIFLSSSVHASELSAAKDLQPESTSSEFVLPENCADLGIAMQDWRERLIASLNQNLNHLDDLAYTTNNWYSTLRSVEGRPTTFTFGYFQPIRNTELTIRSNRNYFFDQWNSGIADFNQLIQFAAGCQVEEEEQEEETNDTENKR